MLLFVLSLFGLPVRAESDAPTVVVLYPEIGEPYKSIFVAIIDGVEAELGRPPVAVAIRRDEDPQRTLNLIKRVDAAAVIALGRTGVQFMEQSDGSIPVVRGAILEYPGATDNEAPGISLAPDPAVLFKHLTRIAPHVGRVTLVYSQTEAQAIAERAAEQAEKFGLTLTVHKAEDLISAAAIFKEVVPKLNEADALWLLQDPQAVDERVVLPLLLNEAWERQFVFFSSYADHAKRGALFSVYPDNFGMGRRLGRMAVQVAGQPEQTGSLQLLEDLFVAVNIRAAEHLGITFSPALLHSFDLTFPQR